MNRFVPSVSRCLIPAFATACLATAALAQQGPPGGLGVTVLNNPLPVTGTVAIVNPPNAPAPAVSITNPADIAKALGIGEPAHFEAECRSTPGIIGSCSAQIPPGPTDLNTRFVVEYASVVCNMVPANVIQLNIITVVTSVGGQSAARYLNVSDHFGGVDNGAPINDNIVSLGHVVRFSHDWVKPFEVRADWTHGPNPDVRCFFSLDGQRVKP